MSDINSIANGSYTIGETNNLTFQAGPGITVTEPTAGTVRIGTDETVLYSGTTAAKQPQSAVTLSEPATNFEKLDILYWDRYLNISDSKTVYTSNMGFNNESYSRVNLAAPFLHESAFPMFIRASQYKFSNNTTMTYESNNLIMITPSGIKSTYSTTPDNGGTYIYKVVGINRISGGNA